MERVRAKAQSAIDQANTAYSQQRTVLMARFDALVTYLSQQQAAAAAQRQHVSAAAQQHAVTAAASAHQSSGGGAAAAGAGAAHGGRAAAPGEGQGGAAVAAANPMHLLSHAMASQLLSLQANMAQAAAAAAANKAGGGGGGNAAMLMPQAVAAAHHPVGAAFAQWCSLPEADLRAQVWAVQAVCHFAAWWFVGRSWLGVECCCRW